MSAQPKTAAKFRAMAVKLAAEIAGKRRGRRESTPRQQKQAVVAAVEADHLTRVRDAMVKLADAHDRGDVPADLAGVKTKADLAAMLRTRIDCSGGYYSMRDTGEFSDRSPTAEALRAFLAGARSEADRAADAERERRKRLEELERDVRFRPIPGFFPTPPAVVANVMTLAGIRPDHFVLEPSAGKGDLADAARSCGGAVVVCELNSKLCEILEAKGYAPVQGDFLALFPVAEADGVGEARPPRYDRAVMNPPFERGQDADHVRHAFALLKPHGRLVSVMSVGTWQRSGKKEAAFREWFESVGGERVDLPDGAFEGGFKSTATKTCLVVIDKD